MVRPAHDASPEMRQRVADLAAFGTPQAKIAAYFKIDEDTLVKYYKEELACAGVEKNSHIANCLFQKASEGDIGAMIFWLKTRAKWRDKDPEDQQAKAATQLLIEMLAAEKSKSLK